MGQTNCQKGILFFFQRVRTTPKPRPPPPPPPPATGDQWPYRPRGENPIFNFDGGDKEDIFLMNTFPNLVDELYDMANAVKDGTKVTKAYVKAFEECSQC